MAVVGFDFGTTNSLISVIVGGRAISFLDEDGNPTPSMACYEGSKTIVGKAARERLAEAGLGVHGNVVRSPKTHLGRETLFVGGVERTAVDVVRDVISYVRDQAIGSRQAKDIRDFSVDKVVVTIPVNMTGQRRAALRKAFSMADVSIVQFVHEPLAALYGYLRSTEDFAAFLRKLDKQLILVVDWGGGTLDLTLCRIIDGVLVQIINDGTEEVGGDEFDVQLRNEVLKRAAAARGMVEEIPLQLDAEARIRHRCELAKIELSQRQRAQIFVRNVFKDTDDPDLEYLLTRDELEEIVGDLLGRGISRIDALLRNGGYSVSSIGLCLAVGGMANVPAVRTHLNERFGPLRVHLSEHSASLISQGAAWVAHDQARLQLAKDVEVLLARNTQVPIIQFGTQMPNEGEVCKDEIDLYCVDPRDGHAKVQLQSPLKSGRAILPNEPRQPIASFLLKVDEKARPFTERLRLKVVIDHDLILRATISSPVGGGFGEAEVHDLTFGLAVGEASKKERKDKNTRSEANEVSAHQTGEVVVRSNLIDRVDESFVPGDVRFQYDRLNFDPENGKATREQRDEHMYYQSCSYCGELPCICEKLRKRGWRSI